MPDGAEGAPAAPPAEADPAPTSGRRPAGAGAGDRASAFLDDARDHALRLGGWMALLSLLGAGTVVLVRRSRSGARGLASQGSLRVLSRALLSPRHQVVLVEAEGRRVLLGVHPEGVTRLLDWTSAPTQTRDPAPTAPATEIAAPRESPGVPAECPLEDSELVPYRRQMQKLRALLHGEAAQGEESFLRKRASEAVERGTESR